MSYGEVSIIGIIGRPQMGLVCPVCNSEVELSQIIERRGYIGCINCTK